MESLQKYNDMIRIFQKISNIIGVKIIEPNLQITFKTYFTFFQFAEFFIMSFYSILFIDGISSNYFLRCFLLNIIAYQVIFFFLKSIFLY